MVNMGTLHNRRSSGSGIRLSGQEGRVYEAGAALGQDIVSEGQAMNRLMRKCWVWWVRGVYTKKTWDALRDNRRKSASLKKKTDCWIAQQSAKRSDEMTTLR